jgi:hypothetical protein
MGAKSSSTVAGSQKDGGRHPGKYQFVLSGSANLLLMKQVGKAWGGSFRA